MKHIKLFETFLKHEYKELLDFISSTDGYVHTYLHTTKEEETCKKIMEEGYQYDIFRKTTDDINKDMTSLAYNIYLRTAYGNYIIIIQIDDNIPKDYDLLTIKEPFMGGEDGDQLMYTLPPRFVMGYYNKETDTIVENPNFDPR